MPEPLSIAPDGCGLYIYDLPTYYAAGDEDLLYVVRSVSLGSEPVAYDQDVADFIDKVGNFRLDSRTEMRDETGRSDDVLKGVIYISTQTTLTEAELEARMVEFVAPLRSAAGRADRRLTKFRLG